MPSEIIREVTIVAKIKVEGDQALKKIQEQARRWNGELEKTKRNEKEVTNEVKKLTQETNKTQRAQVGLDDALGKVKKAITQASEAYIKGNRSAGKGLDILIRKERQLEAQIKRRESAINRARGGAQPRSGVLGRVTGGVSSLRAAGVAAAPVAIVAIAGRVLNAWGEATNRARRLKKDFGIESSGLEKFSGALGSLLGIDTLGLFGPGGAFAPEQKELPATNQDQAIAARERELNLLSQMKQSVEDRYGKEFANQKQIIENEKKKLQTIEQQALAEEKQRRKQVGGALVQLTDQDQRAVLESLKRFQKGGAAALGKDEGKFLGSQGFLKPFFEGEALNKPNPVLDEITKIIGEGRRKELAQEKQKVQAAILKADSVTLNIEKGITVGDIIIETKGLEIEFEKANKILAEELKKQFEIFLIDQRATIRNIESQRKNNVNVN